MAIVSTPVIGFVTNPIQTFSNLHEQYGGLVTTEFFGHKTLFVSDPGCVEEVLNLEAKNLINRDFMYEARKPLLKNGLANSHFPIWKNQRRIMQPYFTKDAVTTWQSIIMEAAAASVKNIKVECSKSVNITTEIRKTIHSIALQIMFGRTETTVNHDLLLCMDTITNGMAKLLAAEVFGKSQLRWLLALQRRQYNKALNKFTEYVQNEIDHKNNSGMGHDILSMLMIAKNKDTEYKMSPELLHDEMVNLFFAGQDTTNHALAWFFYLIGKHPDIHSKITAEIVTNKDTPFSTATKALFPYTNAALQETLRLYPPIIARALQCLEDVEIGNIKASKGSIVFLSICATHRDKALWARPEQFFPEHFLDEHSEGRHRYTWYPFGGGHHNCIGKHLAEMEMMIFITEVLKNYTFKTNINVKPSFGLTLKPNRHIIGRMLPIE